MSLLFPFFDILPFFDESYFERQHLYYGVVEGDPVCDPITQTCSGMSVKEVKVEEIPGTPRFEHDLEKTTKIVEKVTEAAVKPIAVGAETALKTFVTESPVTSGLVTLGIGAAVVIGLIVLFK